MKSSDLQWETWQASFELIARENSDLLSTLPSENSENDLREIATEILTEIRPPPPPPPYELPNLHTARGVRDLLRPRRVHDRHYATKHRLAHPGELQDEEGHPAVLYDFFRTSAKALDEFGIGVSLYFLSIRVLFIIFSICALISLIAINANRSNQYTNSSKETGPYCPDPSDNISGKVPTKFALLGSVYGTRSEDLKLYRQGVSDIVITIFLALCSICFHYALKREINRIDEDQQTTKDYSVMITNPPKDILDPEIYRSYFENKFGSVCFVTVAVQNGELMDLFARRKIVEEQLSSLLVENSLKKTTFLPSVLSKLRDYGVLPSIETLSKQKDEIRKQILKLTKLSYLPWRVFITFNSQITQRNCVKEYSGNLFEIAEILYTNRVPESLDEKSILLRKSPEPSEVIYKNNHRSRSEIYQSLACSYVACAILLCIAYVLVKLAYGIDKVSDLFRGSISGTRRSTVRGTIATSLVNLLLPIAIKQITFRFELHDSEADVERSILIKLLFARCINGALFLFIRTPRDQMFSATTLSSIQYILMADATFAPLIRCLNLWDIFQRYSSVKLYHTQSEINAKWQGTKWTMAERYTDCLKTVYTGLFYAVPLPSGLFLVVCAMLSTYCVDKYSLFRLWKRNPDVGPSLCHISNNFLAFTVLTHIATSYYFFSYWPFCSQKSIQDHETIQAIYKITLIILVIVFGLGSLYQAYRKFLNRFGVQSSLFSVDALESNDDSGGVSQDLWVNMTGNIFLPSISDSNLIAPLFIADVRQLPPRYSPKLNAGDLDHLTIAKGICVLEETPEFQKTAASELQRWCGSIKCFGRIPNESEDVLVGDLETYQMLSSSNNLSGGSLIAYSELERVSSAITPSAASFSLQKQQTSRKFFASRVIDNCILPPGWEYVINSEGQAYYVNHITRESSWEMPREISHL